MKTKNLPSDGVAAEQKQALELILGALRKGDPDKVLRLFLREQAQNLFPDDRRTLEWLARTIGRRPTARLVSVLAASPCFNCEYGLVGCDNCEDAGHFDDEFICESCLGLGRLPCDFCGGTGLASIDFMPLGLRLAVFAIRVKNAEKQFERLLQVPMPSAQCAVRAFNRRTDFLFALNRQISVLETTVGVVRNFVKVPHSLKGRVTRIANEAVRISLRGENKLASTVEAMLGACRACTESNEKGSKAYKLAVARMKYFGSLLQMHPRFKGTYLEHPFLSEAAKKQLQKKKLSARE